MTEGQIFLSDYEQRYIGRAPMEYGLRYRDAPDLDLMQESFYRTLRKFPRLSSIVTRDGDRYALQLHPQGARFGIAPPLEIAPGEALPLDRLRIELTSELGSGLLSVLLTPVVDGSLILTLSMAHFAGDATTAYIFMSAWGREYLKLRDTGWRPEGQTRCADHGLIRANPPFAFDEELTYSSGEFESMRAAATGSSFHALFCAHVFKAHAARVLPDSDVLRAHTSIDIRGRHPDLPPTFVGNAVVYGIASFEKAELLRLSLDVIAERIRESIEPFRDPTVLARMLVVERGCLRSGPAWSEYAMPTSQRTDIVLANLLNLRSGTGEFASFGSSSYPERLFIMSPSAQGIIVRPSKEGGAVVRLWRRGNGTARAVE